jgi:hypothetical protein
MNIDRLKFAWARGARIQARLKIDRKKDSLWTTVGLPGWNSHTDYRIHPDDAHLEYGPLSSALRLEATTGEPLFYSPYREMAWLWVREYMENFGIDLREGANEIPSFMLFAAEYLADMGL